MNETISLSGIWKRFGTTLALADVSFQVQPSEFFVLIGPSGAGKTTTLRVVSGLESPTAGQIKFGERLMNDVAPQVRNARMAFENYSLYPHMTVRENLASPLRAQKTNKRDMSRRILQISKMLGLEVLLDRLPRELSGGQRQRVSLGRALIVEASVLLLDEPLAHLDARIRHELRAKFQDIKSFISQAAVIYVTHDYLEALALADRIGVIVSGKIQQIGTPEDIYYRPANLTVARLVGQPAINVLKMEITRANGDVWLQKGKMRFLPPRNVVKMIEDSNLKTITLGIRPQFWETSDTRPVDSAGYMETRIGLFEIRNYKGIIRADGDASKLLVLCDTYTNKVEGNMIWLRPKWEQVLFYDENERRLANSNNGLGGGARGNPGIE
ncbi:MAG: ABC transporter ATP-binding protein [Spirochaetia bacterium]